MSILCLWWAFQWFQSVLQSIYCRFFGYTSFCKTNIIKPFICKKCWLIPLFSILAIFYIFTPLSPSLSLSLPLSHSFFLFLLSFNSLSTIIMEKNSLRFSLKHLSLLFLLWHCLPYFYKVCVGRQIIGSYALNFRWHIVSWWVLLQLQCGFFLVYGKKIETVWHPVEKSSL